MSVKVVEAEDVDMNRIFELTARAFARNEPVWDVMYPQHWRDSGRKVGGERFRAIKNADPQTTFLKAVDPLTGEIMGMAKWNVYDNQLPDPANQPPTGDYWENDDKKAYASEIIQIFTRDRDAAIKASDGNLVSLEILTVDPAFQRRGVGAALVAWGTKIADELGVDTVVESSVFGKGLYLKNGFQFVKDVTVSPPEKWAGRPEGSFAWLVRPKRQ